MREKLEKILVDLKSIIKSEKAADLDEEVIVGLKAAWADIEWLKQKLAIKN